MTDGLTKVLRTLGWSKYEAVAYEALLRKYPVTGYAIAQSTGIPQPKIYDVLSRLRKKKYVMVVEENPTLYAPIPPDELLRRVEAESQNTLSTLKTEIARIEYGHGDIDLFWNVTGYLDLISKARQVVGEASERLYISAFQPELNQLADVLVDAEERGIVTVLVHFGEHPPEVYTSVSYRHSSTNGTELIGAARTLIIIADSKTCVWGVTTDGSAWQGGWTKYRGFIVLAKQWIKHDIYIQKVYEHMPDQMKALFGERLELLTDIYEDRVLMDGGSDSG